MITVYYTKKKKSHKLLKFLAGAALGYSAYKLYSLYCEPVQAALPGVSDEKIKGKITVGHTGEDALFFIYGMPGKSYDITVYNPSSQASESQGLESKVADAEGYCEWSWSVGNNTALGEGSIVVNDSEGRKWTFAYRVED